MQNENFTSLKIVSQPMLICKDSMAKLYKFRCHLLSMRTKFKKSRNNVSISKTLFDIQTESSSILCDGSQQPKNNMLVKFQQDTVYVIDTF